MEEFKKFVVSWLIMSLGPFITVFILANFVVIPISLVSRLTYIEFLTGCFNPGLLIVLAGWSGLSLFMCLLCLGENDGF